MWKLKKSLLWGFFSVVQCCKSKRLKKWEQNWLFLECLSTLSQNCIFIWYLFGAHLTLCFSCHTVQICTLFSHRSKIRIKSRRVKGAGKIYDQLGILYLVTVSRRRMQRNRTLCFSQHWINCHRLNGENKTELFPY